MLHTSGNDTLGFALVRIRIVGTMLRTQRSAFPRHLSAHEGALVVATVTHGEAAEAMLLPSHPLAFLRCTAQLAKLSKLKKKERAQGCWGPGVRKVGVGVVVVGL